MWIAAVLPMMEKQCSRFPDHSEHCVEDVRNLICSPLMKPKFLLEFSSYVVKIACKLVHYILDNLVDMTRRSLTYESRLLKYTVSYFPLMVVDMLREVLQLGCQV